MSGLALGGVGFAGLATAAGACCTPFVAPFIIATLGAGGAAWAAGLEPWSSWLLVTSGGFVGLAHWRLRLARAAPTQQKGRATDTRHRAEATHTTPGACPTRVPWLARGAIWLATTVWLGAAAVHFWTLAAPS